MWGNLMYLRTPKRRPVRLGRYLKGEDLQNCLPYGWCAVCGREVYGPQRMRCAECGRQGRKNEKIT